MGEKNEKLCSLIRARIAERNVPKKLLARKCDLDTSLFSKMLHGDRPFTPAVIAKLTEELKLEPYMERLGL
jgi:hypothetical protein